jgi:hypothetical protein
MLYHLVALSLALLGGFHAYHSTSPATNAKTYSEEQRNMFLKVRPTSTSTNPWGYNHNVSGFEVGCKKSNATSFFFSPGGKRCD